MLALSSCGLLALLLAVQVIVATHPGGMLSGQLGFDYDMYMNATRRFLAGGGFYAPGQLAGPYAVTDGNILYPPSSLALLVPFTLLPAVLWWAVPLGIIGWVIATDRPSPWALAAILALLVLPVPFDWHFSHALVLVATGNPAMWIAAAVAVGTRWGWPAAFVLLKPSVAPFALIGIRSRGWWVAAGVIVDLLPGHAPAVARVRDRGDERTRTEGDPALLRHGCAADADSDRCLAGTAEVSKHEGRLMLLIALSVVVVIGIILAFQSFA